VAVRLGGTPLAQKLAHRAVYLARFWDWCRRNPCPTFPKRFELYGSLIVHERLDGPIDYLEFGVFRGASLRWWVEHVGHPGATFTGFDTFEGLPEDWSHTGLPKGTFSAGGQIPDIPDPRCRFEKGLFQDTLLPFIERHDLSRRLVVHMDADLYGATLFVLLHLLPRMKPGDLLIFDEFHDYTDEFRAYEDALAAFPRSFAALGHTPGFAQVALQIL
jgi:hypothetical protein